MDPSAVGSSDGMTRWMLLRHHVVGRHALTSGERTETSHVNDSQIRRGNQDARPEGAVGGQSRRPVHQLVRHGIPIRTRTPYGSTYLKNFDVPKVPSLDESFWYSTTLKLENIKRPNETSLRSIVLVESATQRRALDMRSNTRTWKRVPWLPRREYSVIAVRMVTHAA